MRTRLLLLTVHGLALALAGSLLVARLSGFRPVPLEPDFLAGLVLALLVFAFWLDRSRADRFLLEPRFRGLVTKGGGSLLQAAVVSLALGALLSRGGGHGLAGTLGGGMASMALVSLSGLAARRVPRSRFLGEGLLVVGAGESARRFYGALVDSGSSTVAWGVVRETLEPEFRRPRPFSGKLIDGRSLSTWARQHGFRRLVVAESPHRMGLEAVWALLECKVSGIRVEQAVDSGGRLWSKVVLAGVSPEALVFSEGFRPSEFYLGMKRVVDVVCAVALLGVTAPLLLLLAVIIKAESPGPVLYRQERVGLHGEFFTILKFRSMVEGAERETGPTWALANDDRVTRVGRILRKFRLDEIAQVVNVFRGEMSFIGPRPERPHFVHLLESSLPCYPLRHSVKPGITGWAQVMYAYGASKEDAYQKLQFDLYYIKHMSLALDLRILLRTARIVLFGRGR